MITRVMCEKVGGDVSLVCFVQFSVPQVMAYSVNTIGWWRYGGGKLRGTIGRLKLHGPMISK